MQWSVTFWLNYFNFNVATFHRCKMTNLKSRAALLNLLSDYYLNIYGHNGKWGTLQSSWLRHYATSRKVAVSCPDWVDYFQLT
jgi:hypothetical protein